MKDKLARHPEDLFEEMQRLAYEAGFILDEVRMSSRPCGRDGGVRSTVHMMHPQARSRLPSPSVIEALFGS